MATIPELAQAEALVPPPPAERHWFDLSCPSRRRVLLPPNPPEWIHRFDLDFAPGQLRTVEDLVVADRAGRPFAAHVLAHHPDGSIASARMSLPVGALVERHFPRWVDIYVRPPAAKESKAQNHDAACVFLDSENRRIRSPYYTAEFDAHGNITQMRYLQMEHNLVGGDEDVEKSAGAGAMGSKITALFIERGRAPVALDDLVAAQFTIEEENGEDKGLTGNLGRDAQATGGRRTSARNDDNADPGAEITVRVENDTPLFRMTRRFHFGASAIRVDYRIEARCALDLAAPLCVRHRPRSGTIIAPDGRRDSWSSTGRIGTDVKTTLKFPGYVFSSQTGYFVFAPGPLADPASEPANIYYYETARGACGPEAALACGGLTMGQIVEGTMWFLPAPFAGDFGLERLEILHDLIANPASEPVRVLPEEARPAAFDPRAGDASAAASSKMHPAALSLAAGNSRLVARRRGPTAAKAEWGIALETASGREALALDSPWGIEDARGRIAWNAPRQAEIDRGRLRLTGLATGPGGEKWRVESKIIPRLLEGRILFTEERRHTLATRRAVRARFRAEVRTPVAPPRWAEGEATLFIPGNFARGNYAPGQPHGGGPKWGPSEAPEICESCKWKSTLSHANHWTFSASRLPNTWAAAADRAMGLLAFAGTDPRSDMGECAVGFRAPADGTATLRLATPITYEPWVPHGYGGFDGAPRYDTRLIGPGETAAWTLHYACLDTQSLNDWLELDAALYDLHARFRPNAYKMPRERALRITLDSLYSNFYKPDRHIITYSTGPDGQGAPIGFTGMSHSALALLEGGTRLGEPKWRAAGIDVLDEVSRAFLNGPEFPFAGWNPSGGWGCGSGEPGYLFLCALDNLLEAISLERARGETHELWERAARRCCEAWLKVQRADGAYPLKHPLMGAEQFPTADYEATNVTVGVIACLVDARQIFGEERYLESARRAAEFYGRLLDEGKLWGGPGDIEALVNSEVPMFYLRSYVRLAEATRDKHHLNWARESAAWRLSFQYGHCWSLDFGSPLYLQGWAGLGSESASASNLHSVCFGAINVPDYARAARLLGGDFWPARLRDLADYATQQYGRFHSDAGGILDQGQGTESWWTSDTRWGKGSVLLIRENPNLGFMSWTTAWSAYGLLSAH